MESKRSVSSVKIIIPMGVAGAGKSVQGKLLAEKLGYQWVSTGALLRERASESQRERMNAGKLLDDSEIIALVQDFFANVSEGERYVLDGFPRTVPQAEWLQAQHRDGRITIESVVHLNVSKETVLSRLVARGRADDTPEVAERRYQNYMQVTEPVIEWFKEHGILVHEINGEHDIDNIHEQVLQSVQSSSHS